MVSTKTLLLKHYYRRQGKEPEPKLFGPDIFGWGGGLPREGVGVKKFGRSFETHENQFFFRDILGFCRDIPGVPEKFEKKRFGFNSRPLYQPLVGLSLPLTSFPGKRHLRSEFGWEKCGFSQGKPGFPVSGSESPENCSGSSFCPDQRFSLVRTFSRNLAADRNTYLKGFLGLGAGVKI